jgi:hypothetical protein
VRMNNRSFESQVSAGCIHDIIHYQRLPVSCES